MTPTPPFNQRTACSWPETLNNSTSLNLRGFGSIVLLQESKQKCESRPAARKYFLLLVPRTTPLRQFSNLKSFGIPTSILVGNLGPLDGGGGPRSCTPGCPRVCVPTTVGSTRCHLTLPHTINNAMANKLHNDTHAHTHTHTHTDHLDFICL